MDNQRKCPGSSSWHPLGFPCQISSCSPGPQQAFHPAPHLHPIPTAPTSQPQISSPKKSQRNPNGLTGASVELGVGPTCPSLPGCWCHPSPAPSTTAPRGFHARPGGCSIPTQFLVVFVDEDHGRSLPAHCLGAFGVSILGQAQTPLQEFFHTGNWDGGLHASLPNQRIHA